MNFDTIVLGAGVAGLAAGRSLAEAGQRVAILEARDRVGGRIFTTHSPGTDYPIELGAEFVHGCPPELLQLIEEAGLPIYERDGRALCFENGRLEDCSFGDAFHVLDELPASPDMTFAEFLATKTLPEETAQRTASYVEGFNAADAQRIGTASLLKQQQAEEEIEGDRGFCIRNGYENLPLYLAKRFREAGGEIYLQTLVENITWKPGHVTVHTGNPAVSQLSAPRVVIALPLGVLQSGSVRIAPAVGTQSAIDKLAMGTAARITMVFRERFWLDAAPDLSFLFSREQIPATWWTVSPDPAPVLTGWVGGPRVHQLPSGEARKNQALAVLQRAFSRSDLAELLVSWHTHDWQDDPFSRGAYSYAPKGALQASSELAQPNDNTIYFAGEHTDITGHWGTVHGALRSGLRAATQILSQVS
ncbi:flavin monoamine oxidase family protein [Silvibacterium acidisoli]|uniref:flavin monoamine oxidase family protein n=1 Tax=Acidobacteriaceae bacterium ZG23-2 TaxID=2883246 RepID=UPI00406C717A